MKSASHQIPAGLKTVVHNADRGCAREPFAGFSQGSCCSRVVRDVKALLDSLEETAAGDHCRDKRGQLVGAVIVAFVEGDLEPGHPFPEPAMLARACHMPLHEVLDAISFLLNRRILKQDCSGALCIHPKAAPSLDMKQQAFLIRARQLVRQAHDWHLPNDGLHTLFEKAARETA